MYFLLSTHPITHSWRCAGCPHPPCPFPHHRLHFACNHFRSVPAPQTKPLLIHSSFPGRINGLHYSGDQEKRWEGSSEGAN